MTEFVKLDNRTFFETVKESLANGSHVKIPVTGNSMHPFLKNRDVVSVEPFIGNPLKRGMIALADWNGGYVLHRIVGAKENTIVLAGDNNLGQVEIVPSSALFAIVSACYRDGKLFSNQSRVDRILGLGYYYLRPVRRVFAKINRMLK